MKMKEPLIDKVKLDYNLMGLTKRDVVKILEEAVWANKLRDTWLLAYEGADHLSEDAIKVINSKITWKRRARKLIMYPIFRLTLAGLKILNHIKIPSYKVLGMKCNNCGLEFETALESGLEAFALNPDICHGDPRYPDTSTEKIPESLVAKAGIACPNVKCDPDSDNPEAPKKRDVQLLYVKGWTKEEKKKIKELKKLQLKVFNKLVRMKNPKNIKDTFSVNFDYWKMATPKSSCDQFRGFIYPSLEREFKDFVGEK